MANNQLHLLLATYDSAKYLNDLLSSLLKQTCTDWMILLRDDLSTDSSLEIAENFSQSYPGRMFRIKDGLGNLGASGNFGNLMETSSANYIMFVDADDVWMDDKIERSLAEIKRLEAIYGTETPLLVHTDLAVTDKNLKVISPSYWSYQNIDPTRTKLPQLLVQNVVTGCTIIINKALRNIAIPIPTEVIMHDWWLALVASLFGRVSHLKGASIYYRQHGSNDVGAKQWNFRYIQKRFGEWHEIKSQLLKYQIQARCLLDRYGDKLNAEQLSILQDVAVLNQSSKIKRIKTIIKHRLYKNGTARNIGSFLNI